MPWTASSAYPHAFASSVDLGPTANLLSYSIFENVMWKATSGQVRLPYSIVEVCTDTSLQINRWRKNELGLAPTSLHKMSQRKVPFVYNVRRSRGLLFPFADAAYRSSRLPSFPVPTTTVIRYSSLDTGTSTRLKSGLLPLVSSTSSPKVRLLGSLPAQY